MPTRVHCELSDIPTQQNGSVKLLNISICLLQWLPKERWRHYIILANMEEIKASQYIECCAFGSSVAVLFLQQIVENIMTQTQIISFAWSRELLVPYVCRIADPPCYVANHFWNSGNFQKHFMIWYTGHTPL